MVGVTSIVNLTNGYVVFTIKNKVMVCNVDGDNSITIVSQLPPFEHSLPRVASGPKDTFVCMSFDPNPVRFYRVNSDGSCSLVFGIKIPETYTSCIAFHESEKYMMLGNIDGSMTTCSIDEQFNINVLNHQIFAHRDVVSVITFLSEDVFITGGYDGRIVLWKLNTTSGITHIIARFPKYSEQIQSIVFAYNTIIVGYNIGILRGWSYNTNENCIEFLFECQVHLDIMT
jgi:WD40 repeat protein